MLINLLLLLGTFTGTIGLQWASSVTFPNSTRVNTCLGGTATFPWSFSLSSSEQVIDIEWHHVYNNQETLLAAYVSHNFLPYGDSGRRLSMVGNAGLQLTGVTSSDMGQYSVRVNLNGGQQFSQTALLHEPEAPVTVSNNLRANIVSTTQFLVINGESHLQLGCGTFTSLGQPPISVTWRTPSGHFLSSTYDNGVFAVTLPNPLEGGNYTCQLNGVPTGQSCLQNNPLFHITSAVYVDDVTWSLQLLRNDMKWLTEAYISQFELLDASIRPPSCLRIKDYDGVNRIHAIYPDGSRPVKVYCDQSTDNGGWTVIQNRQDGSVDFYRNWTEYESGFGNPESEYWIGLANLHVMTSGKTVILRVDLMDFNGTTAYAMYNTFHVSGPEDNYRLTRGIYYGTAASQGVLATGNRKTRQPQTQVHKVSVGDSLQTDNNTQFSTYDRDHDVNSSLNCAVDRHGAWWYHACSNSNLNGRYYSSGVQGGDIIWWYTWHNDQSLKRVEMKIRV